MGCYDLDVTFNFCERILSRWDSLPVLGTPCALLKVAMGTIQVIAAIAMSIFSLFVVCCDHRPLQTSVLYILHGCGNIIAGLFESIPFVGLGIYYYREHQNSNWHWRHSASLSLILYPTIKEQKIRNDAEEAQRIAQGKKEEEQRISRHNLELKLKSSLQDFSPALLQQYNEKPSYFTVNNIIVFCEQFYAKIDKSSLKKIFELTSMLLELDKVEKDILSNLSFKLMYECKQIYYDFFVFLLKSVKHTNSTDQNAIPLINIMKSPYISWEDKLPLIKTLLSMNSNINVQEKTTGDTPLSVAIKNDKIPPKAVAQLLMLGANPNHKHCLTITSYTIATENLKNAPKDVEGNRKLKWTIIGAFLETSPLCFQSKRDIIPELLRLGCIDAAEHLLKMQNVIPSSLKYLGMDYWNGIFKFPPDLAAEVTKNSLLAP